MVTRCNVVRIEYVFVGYMPLKRERRVEFKHARIFRESLTPVRFE
jgi:hypothetical protein